MSVSREIEREKKYKRQNQVSSIIHRKIINLEYVIIVYDIRIESMYTMNAKQYDQITSFLP